MARRKLIRQRPLALVAGFLALAVLACSFNSPTTLNDGRGSADKPVALQRYARTSNYDVRALSVVRPMPEASPGPDADWEYMRVQFQVRCTVSRDKVCDLSELRRQLKLVDVNGIIYDPKLSIPVGDSLEGEILGDAEKAGWLAYAVPKGLRVTRAMAEYGQDHRLFFTIPVQESAPAQ